MFESVLWSALASVGVSLFVVFLTHWTLRIRVGRLERELADLLTNLLNEKRRRAAAASVDSRAKSAAAFDQAMIAKHTGAAVDEPDEPWWAKTVKPHDGAV